MSVPHLAQMLDCSTKTIERQIKAMQESRRYPSSVFFAKAATGEGSRVFRKGYLMFREGMIKGSFAASVILAMIGIAAVDSNPVQGLFLFLTAGAWALLVAAQNGGLE